MKRDSKISSMNIVLTMLLALANVPLIASEYPEVKEKRTITSKTYQLPKGLLQAEISSQPIHYRNKAGELLDMDNQLQPSDKPGFLYCSEKNSILCYFPADLNRYSQIPISFVSGTTFGMRFTEMQFKGTSKPAKVLGIMSTVVSPVLSAGKVGYSGVFPGVGLNIAIGNGRLDFEFVGVEIPPTDDHNISEISINIELTHAYGSNVRKYVSLNKNSLVIRDQLSMDYMVIPYVFLENLGDGHTIAGTPTIETGPDALILRWAFAVSEMGSISKEDHYKLRIPVVVLQSQASTVRKQNEDALTAGIIKEAELDPFFQYMGLTQSIDQYGTYYYYFDYSQIGRFDGSGVERRYRGFMEFNTNSIDDDATVKQADLHLTCTYISNPPLTLYVKSMSTRPSANYSSGQAATTWSDCADGSQYFSTSISQVGGVQFSTGTGTHEMKAHIQDKLKNDWYAVGYISSDEQTNQKSAQLYPDLYGTWTLRVTYEVPDGFGSPISQDIESQVINLHQLNSVNNGMLINRKDDDNGYPSVASEGQNVPVAIISSTTDVPYIIITDSDLASSFQVLANWKTRKGTKTEIKTVSWITSNYSGSDTPEKIRNFIIDYYTNKNTKWVLLGGTVSLVPSRYVYSSIGANTFYSDYYYACLDGDWNEDADTLYGEAFEDNVDMQPEVSVGRVLVSSSSDVNIITNKLLTYERTITASGYQSKALILGSLLFDCSNGQELGDTLANHIPDYFTKTKLYQYEIDGQDTVSGPENLDTVIAAINSGQGIIISNSHASNYDNFIVRYQGNGSTIFPCDPADTIRQEFKNAEADTLRNIGMYPVFINATCHYNMMENDALAKHLLLNDSGGVIAYIGAERSEYAFGGEELRKGLLDEVFTEGNVNIGNALNTAKSSLSDLDGDGANRFLAMGYKVVGDPQMEVWDSLPRFLEQHHLSSFYTGQQYNLADTIKDVISGAAVEGAIVCLMKGTEVYKVDTTGANGIASFTVVFSSTGTATLVASRQGYYPDSTAISIISPPIPTCPFVYAWNGTEFVQDNAILTQSSSVPQGQTVEDNYLLQKPLIASDNQYRLEVREIEDEKTYFDHIELIAVDHANSTRVVVSEDGQIGLADKLFEPVAAIDHDGNDVLSQIISKDGMLYSSETPGQLTITFSLPDKMGKTSVVIAGDGGGGDPCNPNSPGPGGVVDPFDKGGAYNIVRTEIEDKNGNWVELPMPAPRPNPTLTQQIINPSEVELGSEFRVRMSWTIAYSRDQIVFYTMSSSVPTVNHLYVSSAFHSNMSPIKDAIMTKDGQFITLIKGEKLDLYFATESILLEEGYTRDFVVNSSGYYIPLEAVEVSSTPTSYQLFDNYPNPFNAQTEIKYNLPSNATVELAIFNTLGQKVRTLIRDNQVAGTHSVIWDGKNESGQTVASGVYFYTIKAGTYTETKKMMLLK